MKKHTLYIGLNDQDTKVQEIQTADAIKIIYSLLLAHGIDGATIYEAKGIYRHESGEVVIENTIRVELFGAPDNLVTGSIISIKKALNQESIAVQTEKVNSQFV